MELVYFLMVLFACIGLGILARKHEVKKDNERAVICGVCAGLAKAFMIDPLWIRVPFVIFIFCGISLLVYIVLAITLEDK